jgi:membrane protein implicated in regulation of membrane protease activity
MGAVSAWLTALGGFVVLAFVIAICGLIISVPIGIGLAMGGDAGNAMEMIQTVFFKISPVAIVITLVLYAFINSTSNEDDSRWRR